MEFKTFVFYVLSVILVLSALKVITSRNPVYAVLFVVLAFFNAGGIWILLEAEFLAIVLVLVYVGAVMVLFLFVVMMIDMNVDTLREGFWRYFPVGAAIGVLMLAEMVMVLSGQYISAMPNPTPVDASFNSVKMIADALYTHYAYPFELAALVLLVAMIAAVSLTLRKRQGVKKQNPAQQVQVRWQDRIRVVSMPVEKEQASED